MKFGDIYTYEELAEEMCGYCNNVPESGYGDHYYQCGGSQCDKAYQNYLDSNGINMFMVNVKKNVKITIEKD